MIIGLTQRVTIAQPHGEKRDALAHDWYPFLRALGWPWLALPNDAAAAVRLASRTDLGGLILTGGDDIGVFPERDETEALLLDWFRERKRPVIGVCRGFQFIHHRLGGELKAVEPKTHRAQRHEIVVAGREGRVVNSYHNFAPIFAEQRQLMRPLAFCPTDGSVEAACGAGLLGVMWHPEREPEPRREDVDLFKTHFRAGKKQ